MNMILNLSNLKCKIEMNASLSLSLSLSLSHLNINYISLLIKFKIKNIKLQNPSLKLKMGTLRENVRSLVKMLSLFGVLVSTHLS